MQIKVPDKLIDYKTGASLVYFRGAGFPVTAQKIADVPRLMVPELVAQGCTTVDGTTVGDIKSEIASAEFSDLDNFLRTFGQRGHYFEKKTHYLSAHHRRLHEKGCPNCGHKETTDGIQGPLSLHKETADTLDWAHQTINGTGRIVFYTLDQIREKALKLVEDNYAKPVQAPSQADGGGSPQS